MPALPEYRTRELLAREGVPLVEGTFFPASEPIPAERPPLPLFLKAQIPGATSRAAHGLVRSVTTPQALQTGLAELIAPGPWGRAEGVLLAQSVTLQREYYAACLLDFGSADRAPGGVLLFSPEGGSGVEGRSDRLTRIPFSLIKQPDATELAAGLPPGDHRERLADLLAGLVRTFLRYKLLVLEANPIGVLPDGSLLVIDCRAEFETQAVARSDQELFPTAAAAKQDLTVRDPAGTGFFREHRGEPTPGAWRVATNLCGGGGKMLWEMAIGGRTDIFPLNESDTSGGLSAFKSYRIARVILSQPGAQVFLLTGSGMGFQNQYYLAAAIWKALRESPKPLPALLRFGGTDEDKARALFDRVAPTLPVPVKTFFPHVFPNAMLDDIPVLARQRAGAVPPVPQPEGEPTFRLTAPAASFFFDTSCWDEADPPPCVAACPTGFLRWNDTARTLEPVADARCIGCLACETVSLLESRGELRIRLDLPEVSA